jgi:tight adherence protein B
VLTNMQMTFVWVTAVAVFGLIVSLWFMGIVLWNVRRARTEHRIGERLGLRGKPKTDGARVLRLWREDKTATTVVPHTPMTAMIRARVDEIRKAMGWEVPLMTMILILFGATTLGFATVLALTQNFLLASGVGVCLIIVPWLYVKRRVAKQDELFERQLADALGLATRSLRAGHPLLGAFRLIVEEMEAPARDVFAEIVQKQALGVSLEEAIQSTADEHTNSDFKLFAASVIIQLRSGGNLADMMDRLAAVIRDRMRLHRRARVLTSQTQLSKRILMAIPFVIFVMLSVANPGYLEPLYTTFPGKVMLFVSGVMLILGTWVMNRISTLKY